MEFIGEETKEPIHEELYWAYLSKTQLKRVSEIRKQNGKKVRFNYYDDLKGGEILISEVTRDNPAYYHNNFKDVIKLGRVGRWLRSVLEEDMKQSVLNNLS